ncbi:MAG TPA: T9SS type A sorting domain-containing protein [Brumimicrobium sp.]|nr:T9SS type A sorting domain-containing protein [Brumimicrobium sp.]
MFLIAQDIQQIVLFIGWLGLGIIIFFIFYRQLLKRLQRKRYEKEQFFTLYPLEKNPASGTVQIYFEMHSPIEVEVSILSYDHSFQKVLSHQTFKKGGNIVEIDTTEFENGRYFYQAKAHNQKTKKLVEIIN